MCIAAESAHLRSGKAIGPVLMHKEVADRAAEVIAELVNYVEVYPYCVLMFFSDNYIQAFSTGALPDEDSISNSKVIE